MVVTSEALMEVMLIGSGKIEKSDQGERSLLPSPSSRFSFSLPLSSAPFPSSLSPFPHFEVGP